MKNLRIYSIVSLAFLGVFTLVSLFSIPLLVKQQGILNINSCYQNIKNTSQLIVSVAENKKSKVGFTEIVQKGINNTQNNSFFISIIDWTGSNVAYPDITKVGENIDNQEVDFEGEVTGDKIYNRYFSFFNTLKKDINSEVINLVPVKDSDLIIMYHANPKTIMRNIRTFKSQTILQFFLIGLALLIIVLLLIRLLNSLFEKQLDEKISGLTINTQNLEKLNNSLVAYQEKLEQQSEKPVDTKEETTNQESAEIVESTTNKQRILTYVRNELVSIFVTDIAYIYVDNTITYIIRKDGKMSTSGDSLEKIYSVLDKNLFFKTNRQFIVAISAIQKITKYQNNKLKIETKPKSEIDIIIGKNKASAFKQWLDS